MACEVMSVQEIPVMTHMQPALTSHDMMAAQPLVYAMQAGMVNAVIVPMQAAVAMQAGMMAMANPQVMANPTPGYLQLPQQQNMTQPYMEPESFIHNSIEGYHAGEGDASSGRRRRRKQAQPKAVGMIVPQQVTAQAPKASAAFSVERIKELHEDLETGTTEQCSAALEAISGSVWALSKDELGCRLVQLALEKAGPSIAKALALELQGHVREVVASPHGNYVLQKVITHLAPSICSFIAEELLGNGARFARHRFGCRILCRLLEHRAMQEDTDLLVEEILQDAPLDLCRHSFGHHVVQSILEHGQDKHKEFIAHVLLSDLLVSARHRSASYVVESALCHCSIEDQNALLEKLTIPAIVADLAQSSYGCFVARTLLQRMDAGAVEAMAQALPAVATLLEAGEALSSRGA